MGQEIVMTRLDKLEQDQQAAAGQSLESGVLMDHLQRLTLGRPAQRAGQGSGLAVAQSASSSLDVVMSESLVIPEQLASVGGSAGVQQPDSQVLSASAEKDVKDPNPVSSLTGHQESRTNPSMGGGSDAGQGVTLVEGVPYAWRMTPEGLKLQRLEPQRGSGPEGRGRSVETVQAQNPVSTRALSPFVATSAEVERMTPNIRRFHSTSPPRSRSSPKPRPGVLKKSPDSTNFSIQQTPSESRRVVPVRPKIVYPCTPGGTEIRPPPYPCTSAEETKAMSQSAAQGSGDWFSSGMLSSATSSFAFAHVCLCRCRSCRCCCQEFRVVHPRGRFGGWCGFRSFVFRGFWVPWKGRRGAPVSFGV